MNQNNMNNPPVKNGEEMPDLSTVYPEIYYKIMPYIIMICDQLDSYYGDNMPNREMTDRITENIYEDICEMYPDMEEYAKQQENNKAAQTAVEVIPRPQSYYRRPFRRRGLLRDLVDILFLMEFGRRRRRYYY